ncbi:polysaccharide biosynthesis/export family protein [Lysobacter xanthus]
MEGAFATCLQGLGETIQMRDVESRLESHGKSAGRASALRRLNLLVFPLVLVLSCVLPARAGSTAGITAERVEPDRKFAFVYVLRAGDLIDVSVYRHPELSRKLTLRPDGAVTVPLLGDVQAAGKSPSELARLLTQRYEVRIRNPEVTVAVENPPEPVVFILGEVGVTRALPLRQAGNVAQALAQAGALPKSAAISRITVIRLNEQGEMVSYGLQPQGRGRTAQFMALNAMALKPNDLIVVPETYRGQVVRVFQDMVTVLSPYFQLRVLDQQVGFGF